MGAFAYRWFAHLRVNMDFVHCTAVQTSTLSLLLWRQEGRRKKAAAVMAYAPHPSHCSCHELSSLSSSLPMCPLPPCLSTSLLHDMHGLQNHSAHSGSQLPVPCTSPSIQLCLHTCHATSTSLYRAALFYTHCCVGWRTMSSAACQRPLWLFAAGPVFTMPLFYPNYGCHYNLILSAGSWLQPGLLVYTLTAPSPAHLPWSPSNCVTAISAIPYTRAPPRTRWVVPLPHRLHRCRCPNCWFPIRDAILACCLLRSGRFPATFQLLHKNFTYTAPHRFARVACLICLPLAASRFLAACLPGVAATTFSPFPNCAGNCTMLPCRCSLPGYGMPPVRVSMPYQARTGKSTHTRVLAL